MSIENNPNIQAVGLTVDIVNSYMHNLRGKAAEDKPKALQILTSKIVKFVTELSEELDQTFGV